MADVAAKFREYVRLERRRGDPGLTHEELRRWMSLKRALNRHFCPGLSESRADQRGSVRVPTRLVVSFASVGELRHSLMLNLSRGGLFVATDDLFEIGSRLELRVKVEESGASIAVPVEVVSHNVGPGFREQRGMGMRFLDMSPDIEKQLDDLYEIVARRAAD